MNDDGFLMNNDCFAVKKNGGFLWTMVVFAMRNGGSNHIKLYSLIMLKPGW